jgi:uncharacterized protein YecE (DUF72 family)
MEVLNYASRHCTLMRLMAEYRIGTGGWAYFQVPGMDPLAAYSKAYNFVEVNSTFYETPPLKQVASWRERVPVDFEFSVRCHKDLTHKYKLEPTSQAHEVLLGSIEICRTLKAPILLLETPPSFKVTAKRANAVGDLVSSTNLSGIRVAWEIRGEGQGKQLPDYLQKVMQDLDIIHCVDISREDPAYKTDILYTRLFGKGKHNIYQFDDKEIRQIHEKVKKGKEKKVVLSFHGLKMYLDAARFKVYEEKLTLPPVTRSVGLSSLREVLVEDAKFPTTKKDLIEKQGWKVFDFTPTERIHASEILHTLPEKSYQSLDEVIAAVKSEGACSKTSKQ